MPETTDVSCKGSRFNNVISSNVVYIGQQNDEKPAKCPKTCAQRGTIANPATSTREALDLTLQYFGTAPTLFSYGPGTYDVPGVADKAGTDVTIPVTVSMTGLGNGVTLAAGSYSYTTNPVTGDSVVGTESPNVLLNGNSVTNITFRSIIKIGSTMTGQSSAKAMGSFLKTKFQNVNISANDLSNPALSLMAGEGDDIAFTFQDGSIEHLVPGGTALFQQCEGTGQLSTLFQNHTVSAPNGILSRIVGKDNGRLDYSSNYGSWFDTLKETIASPNSPFSTELGGNAVAKMYVTGDRTSVNTQSDTPVSFYKFEQQAVFQFNHSGGNYEQLGKGPYTQSTSLDDSLVSTKETNNSWTLMGPRSNITNLSSVDSSKTSTGNIAKYIGDESLDTPFLSTVVGGLGGYTQNNFNNQTIAKTSPNVPLKRIQNLSNSEVNISSVGSIRENVGAQGSGYEFDNKSNGSIGVNENSTSTTTLGAPCKQVTNTEMGRFALNTNNTQCVLREVSPDSASARVGKGLAITSITSLGVNKLTNNDAPRRLETAINSSADTFTGTLLSSSLDAVSIDNSSDANVTSTFSNSTFNVPNGTAILTKGSGSGNTSVSTVGATIKNAKTFLSGTATENAAMAYSAATTICLSNSGLEQFATMASTSAGASGLILTGAAYEGTTAGNSLFSATGNVQVLINQVTANLTGANDQFINTALTGENASTVSSSSITRRGVGASTNPLIQAIGDGFSSVSMSDVKAHVESGSVGFFSDLKMAKTTLSSLTTKDKDEADLIQYERVEEAAHLSSEFSAESGHIIRTTTGVPISLSAVTTKLANVQKAVYQNEGELAQVLYGKGNNAFLGSSDFRKAILQAVTDTPTPAP